MKIVATNRGKAPQGIHTQHGVVWVRPGSQRDLHVDEDQLARVERLPGIAHEVLEADEPTDQFDAMSDDDLRAHLAERDGKAPHPNAKRETLLAKAREQA